MEQKKEPENLPPATEKITEELEDVLKDLGISMQRGYNLILWNDDVNNMMDVVMALYHVCKLNNDDCIRVMMEAHKKGKSLAKNGDLDELLDMKNGLNARGLTVTVEEAP
ncbi:MAG: ATP-dependent Clp protease adaptor ClpS [Methanosarcina sp.]